MDMCTRPNFHVYIRARTCIYVRAYPPSAHPPLPPCLHQQQPVAPGEFGLLFTDGAKFGRAEQLHLALQVCQSLPRVDVVVVRWPHPSSVVVVG